MNETYSKSHTRCKCNANERLNVQVRTSQNEADVWFHIECDVREDVDIMIEVSKEQ